MDKKPKHRPIVKIKEFLSKIGTLNIVLICVFAFFIWFNWQMLSMYMVIGTMPETYACAVVAATIGECGFCGWIRTTKDRQRERGWEKEDNKKLEIEQPKLNGEVKSESEQTNGRAG